MWDDDVSGKRTRVMANVMPTGRNGRKTRIFGKFRQFGLLMRGRGLVI